MAAKDSIKIFEKFMRLASKEIDVVARSVQFEPAAQATLLLDIWIWILWPVLVVGNFIGSIMLWLKFPDLGDVSGGSEGQRG